MMCVIFDKKFKRSSSGVVAIEMAFLLLPFMVLTIGIIELSLYFIEGVLFEGATNTAARLIRTGQITTAGDPEGAFVAAFCAQPHIIIAGNCAADVSVQASSYGTLAGATAVAGVMPDFDNPGGFNVGGANAVMMIDVWTQYNMITPLIGNILGTQILFSRTVLQIEPL